jgi:putative GTP pyrophosphokinase
MPAYRPTKTILSQIDAAVQAYVARRQDFFLLARRVETELFENRDLKPKIHSTKAREKDPDHLREKLLRKAQLASDSKHPFDIKASNLFRKLGDLAGVRLLHIHTEQLAEIHPKILEILEYYKYTLREKPRAYTWDVNRGTYLKSLGLKVEVRSNLYTSVHYVVQPDFEPLACEIQVRTLAEELWGEVSHKIDYPEPTDSVPCREQLAALARVASGCTRLVDSIFTSHADHLEKQKSGKPNRRTK